MNERTSQEPIGQDTVESVINSIYKMVCERSFLPDDSKRDLLTICGAVLLAEGTGTLSALSVEERAALCSYLQNYQNRDTGFFIEPGTASAKLTDDNGAKTYPLFQA